MITPNESIPDERRYIINYLLDFDSWLRIEYTQDQVGRWYGGHYSEEYMPEESKELEEHGYFSPEEMQYIKEISNLLHEVIDPIEYVEKNGLLKTVIDINYNVDMPIDIYEKVKTKIDEFIKIPSITHSIKEMGRINIDGQWKRL